MNIDTLVYKRSRVLCVDDHTIYAQIGNALFSSGDAGSSWRALPGKLPVGARSFSRMHARVLRRGVQYAFTLDKGRLLLVTGGALYRYDVRDGMIERTFTIERGSRPLNICRDSAGILFWGEYYRNPDRDEVNIYSSEDGGKSWQISYTFERGSVRHVHGVFVDPYDDSVWVTTGDLEHESAIWRTDDSFRTLLRIHGGSQSARTMQLLFTKDYIYFGNDTPFEKNYICRFERMSHSVERLVEVDGSVYWGQLLDEGLIFTTAVEVSDINRGKCASIWFSRDGLAWQRLVSHKKDTWPNPYFQVGQLFVPPGNNETGHLLYTPIATDGDQTIRRIRINS